MTRLDNELGELHSLATFDGKTIWLAPHDNDAILRVYGNYGAPPTNFQTKRGYRQDGETEIAYFLAPRHISVMLFRPQTVDRKTYWTNRAELHDFLRPNRNGPITLTLRTAGNLRRSLVVRADPGLVFAPPPDDVDRYDIDEQVDFTAFNPIWFDPAQVSSSPGNASDSNLVFPITFPIIFGVNGTNYRAVLTYVGTWKTYPVLTLTGPYQSCTITNVTTGFFIQMSVPILAGQQRVIDLTPGAISITDGSGNNKFGDLGPGSDLVDFNIRPDPECAGGVQTIQANFIAATVGQTAFNLKYYNRYFAL